MCLTHYELALGVEGQTGQVLLVGSNYHSLLGYHLVSNCDPYNSQSTVA